MNQSDAELIAIRKASNETLLELTQSLNERGDMQAAIKTLMQSDNMLFTFTQMAVNSPDVMRLVLQAGVASFTNQQAVHAVDAELNQRASRN